MHLPTKQNGVGSNPIGNTKFQESVTAGRPAENSVHRYCVCEFIIFKKGYMLFQTIKKKSGLRILKADGHIGCKPKR